MVILVTCKNENNYIIPIDINLLIPDSTQISNGITVKQQQQRSINLINALRANTVNHEIPDVTVFDLNGKSHNLKEQLIDTKLIITTNLTCAWSMDGFLNDFPKTNQIIENPLNKNEIILLILMENNEYFDRQFKENIEEIKRNYSNIFLIDSLQSLKINMFGLSRYYITKQHIVSDIGRGTYTVDGYLEKELEKNTAANK
jgi:hypothetical protein